MVIIISIPTNIQSIVTAFNEVALAISRNNIINYGSRQFKIIKIVNHDEENRFIILYAEEV